MRAILTSFGTTGDVFPLCTLAYELKRAGHEPRVVVPRHCASLARQLGVECTFYGPDVGEIEMEILRIQNSGSAMHSRYKELVAQLGRSTSRAFSDLAVLCRDADVLICSMDPPLGLTIHESVRIPYVALHLTCPYDDSWYRAEKLAGVNEFRRLLGLTPILDSGGIDPTGISPQLTVFALSRFVFPPRIEWPKHFHVTGFFFPEEKSWEPDPSLKSFMEAGDPPVVITFGSMMHEDPEQVNALLLSAVEQLGCRAALQMSSGQTVSQRRLPSNIHVVGFASHTWLFSHADCVVHHGSPGTAAAVFRAGIPALFVPHAFDQFEMARYACEQGCAAPPLAFTELTVDRLSAAIADLKTNRGYREAAAVLRDKMSTENGVESARLLIEELVTGRLNRKFATQ